MVIERHPSGTALVVSGLGMETSSVDVSSSSSSEELKVRCLHTSLWCGSLVPVLHGVTGSGSKDAFSSLKM